MVAQENKSQRKSAQKYCICCNKVSVFYHLSPGKTYKCCNKCNTLFSSSERNAKIIKNITGIVLKSTNLIEL